MNGESLDMEEKRLKKLSSAPKTIEGLRITAVGNAFNTHSSPSPLLLADLLSDSLLAPIAER